MAYEVTLLEIEGPEDRFEILDGPKKTRAEVVLTYAGVEISFATSSERKLSEIHGIQHLPEAPRERV